MKNGQLTDVQRPSFGFRYFFGGSRGFSGTEETQLISDSIITHDLGPQGAPLTRICRAYASPGERTIERQSVFQPARLRLAA